MSLPNISRFFLIFIFCFSILSANVNAEDVGQDEIPNAKLTLSRILKILPKQKFKYISSIEYNENVWNLTVYYSANSSYKHNINCLPAKPRQKFYSIPTNLESDTAFMSLVTGANNEKTDDQNRHEKNHAINIKEKSIINKNDRVDSSIISDTSVSNIDTLQKSDSERLNNFYHKLPTRKIKPAKLKRIDYIYNPRNKKMLVVSFAVETASYLPPSILYLKKAIRTIKTQNKDALLSYIRYDHNSNQWVSGGTITDTTTGEKAEMKYFVSVDGKKVLNYGINE